ncbi:RidA family protein [Cyclobacterium amurskyense]|uniref:RidA n=1 Tax=Cyclobacterium amurskyense TaxID=320787 RepID=A0A0H4PVB9_9BACT|nr:RidA family protein [Cyclobacterium amurskyense]AKP52327.1 RidA [Cyclobacterium amurskyense]|tara:strand:+ start:2504 stop:3055 length:552 start_codon:yes stop_codon:yes gene_type:complete
MTIKIHQILLLTIFLLVGQLESTFAQNSGNDPEAKLKEMGITLKVPGEPTANFVLAVQVGNLVFLSGHGPMQENGEYMKGKVGSELTVEQGAEAARLTGISLLSSLKHTIGSLNRVKRIVKVLGMVNCVPTFEQQPIVMHGFSDFMVEVFGESGKHARSAVGMGSLPFGIPVEIEMIVELKEE